MSRRPPAPAAHPLLGLLSGPPDADGVLSWRLVIDPLTSAGVQGVLGRSRAQAAAVLGELALAAGAEFFVVRCAEVQVSGLRRRLVPASDGPVRLDIVVTPVGPATARFEVLDRSGRSVAVALLRVPAPSD